MNVDALMEDKNNDDFGGFYKTMYSGNFGGGKHAKPKF